MRVLLAFTLIFTSYALLGLNFASAKTSRPSRPAPVPYPKKPSGSILKVTGTSISSVEYAKEKAQSSANYQCQSGVAVRISSWNLFTTEMVLGGDCREIDGEEYCTSGDIIDWENAEAEFRCK